MGRIDVGDAAKRRKEAKMETNNKLREACAHIVDYVQSAMCHATDAHVLDYLTQVEMWAKAALAEPVKNCEVGTPEEQEGRWNEACNKFKIRCRTRSCYRCAFDWAQMPYEEGGAK